jgi:SNF2 family DNA or RNA helicase
MAEVKIKGRPCGPLKSKKNPDAYTKPELVKMATKKFSITESVANKLTKDQICSSLLKGKVVDKPKAKTAKAKVDEKKAKVAKPKATKPKAKATKSAVDKSKAKAVKPKPKAVKPKAKVDKSKAKVDKSKAKVDKSKAKAVKPKPKAKVDKPKSKVTKKKVTKTTKAKVKVTKRKPCIEGSKLKLRDHQIKVVNHIRKHRGLIVSHDVGSGKTLTAVTASQCFLEDHPNGKIIVVTPVSLQDNFRKEMKAYGVSKTDMQKYEFHTLQGFATEYNEKQCGTSKSPVMLIIDEAHNLRTDIKAAKSAAKKRALTSKKKPVVRADVAIRCARTATKVLLLTATSVYNEPSDIANLVAMVKGEDPLSKKQFYKMMMDDLAFKKYFECVLSFYDIPIDRENYPKEEEHWVDIEMTPKYYKEYLKVEGLSSDYFENPWRFLTGMRQASNALEDCIKCDWVLKKALEGKKMVIYSAFLTFGVDKLKELFDAHGIKYREVTGKMKKDDRTKAVNNYNSDKVDILFITKAGGEGLDLKGTRGVIIFESSWNRATETQVIGRAVRFGSHKHLPEDKRKVDVYHLVIVKPKNAIDTVPSADEMLRNLIETKENVNKEFLKRIIPLSIEKAQC